MNSQIEASQELRELTEIEIDWVSGGALDTFMYITRPPDPPPPPPPG